MTIEEVNEYLEKKRRCSSMDYESCKKYEVCKNCPNDYDLDLLPEVDDITIEAIRKQIPKSWIRNEYFDGECTWECPSCKEEYVLIEGGVLENGYSYCPSCGQKLEWEEGAESDD